MQFMVLCIATSSQKLSCGTFGRHHYNDFIMSAMASQITSLTIVYSTVYSGVDQRKHQSSASLAFVRGIHRWLVNSPHKRGKCFHLMTSSWFGSKDQSPHRLCLPELYSRLIPICNAFHIQRGHRRSLSNRGGERRWPQNKTGVVHRYQATVRSWFVGGHQNIESVPKKIHWLKKWRMCELST